MLLLENKVAVIYGAGGPIGGAVASAFAREGARVFLAGRTRAGLDKLAGQISTEGGRAYPAVVDVLDEVAVKCLKASQLILDRVTRSYQEFQSAFASSR